MSRRLDAAIAVALAGFAAAMWLWLIPAFAGRGEQTIMPRIAVALVGALSLILLASGLVGRRDGRDPATDDPFLETDGAGEPPRLLLLVLVWGVVLGFASFLGLHLAAALGAALSFLLLGVRRPLTVLVWTVLPIAILHVVFEYGFALRLPRGEIVRLLFG